MKKEIIVIISALDEEISEYLAHLTNPIKKEIFGFTFYEGSIHDKDVVISKSGVGKVFAAMTAQKLIDTYNPNCLVFTGIAGALNTSLEIGDIIVTEDCMQHDLDVTALGFTIGTIPYTDYRIFSSDANLQKIALSTSTSHKILKGRVLTGDQFITNKNNLKFKHLVVDLKGDVVEMEGASVGQVCTINNIPFIIIRTVSDKADHSASINFNDFLPVASNNSFVIVNHIIKNIKYERK